MNKRIKQSVLFVIWKIGQKHERGASRKLQQCTSQSCLSLWQMHERWKEEDIFEKCLVFGTLGLGQSVADVEDYSKFSGLSSLVARNSIY